MTEPRESTRVGPDGDAGEGRPASPRRFARLIESHASRRLALPRLVGVGVAGILVLGLGYVAMSRLLRDAAGWVAARPEHQIAFAEVALEPPPPPWIRTGAAGLLHRVRTEARREERLSVLAVDLAELEKDFRRCPWVADVRGVARSYGRLSVRLAYRTPVAAAVITGNRAVVIDRDGVMLPDDEIDWVEKAPIFRVRGMADPLLVIWNVPDPASLTYGLPWKGTDAPEVLDGRDLQVLGAARLAAFLRDRPRETPAGKSAPEVVSIWPVEKSLSYFLKDADEHSIFWDRAPGSEPPGEPTAADKWKMVLDWVDLHGPLIARSPDYLKLTRSGPELVRRSPRPSRYP